MASSVKPWKQVEEAVRIELQRLVQIGLLGYSQKLEDGAKPVKIKGRTVYIHTACQPADFLAWGNTGKALLVEVKRTEGKSLPVEYKTLAGKKNSVGLKLHQMEALERVQYPGKNDLQGGLGLLVVSLGTNVVHALDGAGLRLWRSTEGPTRKSISLDFFERHGAVVGNAVTVNLKDAISGVLFERSVADRTQIPDERDLFDSRAKP